MHQNNELNHFHELVSLLRLAALDILIIALSIINSHIIKLCTSL